MVFNQPPVSPTLSAFGIITLVVGVYCIANVHAITIYAYGDVELKASVEGNVRANSSNPLSGNLLSFDMGDALSIFPPEDSRIDSKDFVHSIASPSLIRSTSVRSATSERVSQRWYTGNLYVKRKRVHCKFFLNYCI